MKYVKTFSLYESARNKEHFPSEEFGKKTGMDWIYVDWKLPTSADEAGENLGKWIDMLSDKKKGEEAAKKLMEFYYTLLKLNPELEKLGEPKSWDNIMDFSHGVVSKFNIDDIKFYSDLGWNERAMYNMQNRKLMDDISKKADAPTGWVMSPKTIERVKKELKMK